VRRIHEWSPTGAEASSRGDRDAANGDTRFGPPPRVLHVERDTFVAALVHATLEDAGFDVDWYPSPETALAGEPAQYDVCLLQGDVVGSCGRTTAETVARLARGAPIVFLTDKLEARARVPRVSMLSKPVSPRALVEAVETALRKGCRAA
jgi:DNA-binding response OmpR family regulator